MLLLLLASSLMSHLVVNSTPYVPVKILLKFIAYVRKTGFCTDIESNASRTISIKGSLQEVLELIGNTASVNINQEYFSVLDNKTTKTHRLSVPSDDKVWEEVESTLKHIVKDGVFTVNKKSGSVTVTANQYTHNNVEKYLDEVLINHLRQSLISITIIQVISNEDHFSGSQWENIFKILSGKLGVSASLSENGIEVHGNADGLKMICGALSKYGRVRTKSNVLIATSNNQTGKIEHKQQLPYFNPSNAMIINGKTVDYDQAHEIKVELGTFMSVTPTIAQDQLTVKLDFKTVSHIGDKPNPIVIGNAKYVSKELVEGSKVPVTSTQSISTTVILKDRTGILLGGLVSRKRIRERSGIPILGLSFLGRLLGKSRSSYEYSTTYIYITSRKKL